MALDSAAKRQAAVGVGRPWKRGPAPDATMGKLWRTAVGNTYHFGGTGVDDTVKLSTVHRSVCTRRRSTFRQCRRH